MYELKNGTARIVHALEARQDDPATLAHLAQDLNYHPEQLRQDLKALADYHSLFEPWSNNACLGYLIAGAEAAGLPRKQLLKLIDATEAAFENMTLQEAEDLTESGNY